MKVNTRATRFVWALRCRDRLLLLFRQNKEPYPARAKLSHKVSRNRCESIVDIIHLNVAYCVFEIFCMKMLVSEMQKES